MVSLFGIWLIFGAALGCPQPVAQSECHVNHSSYWRPYATNVSGTYSLRATQSLKHIWMLFVGVVFRVPWCSTGLGLRCTVGFTISGIGTVIV